MSNLLTKKAIQEIITLIHKAQEIATQHGWSNIVQPGLIKEMIVADILGHEVHKTKHQPDAFEYGNPKIGFEYLTCKEGGSFQLDRMFKHPPAKREKSLNRINRNKMIYCAIFNKDNMLEVLEIWQIDVSKFLAEATRQLENSSNDISHIGIPISWAKTNGKLVYPKARP